jgi:branched-chain amino acid transport system ATP-binding protein
VTFDVRPGEAFGIVGPNGAGKTTILNVISGVVRPATGTVRYGDTDLLRILPHDMRRQGIGRSLQSTHYFRDLTVLQLVALAELPNSVTCAVRFTAHRIRPPRGLIRARISSGRGMHALEQLGLEGYADRPLHELSSAVQKLVDIARAVVAGTELLLLDEPTSRLVQLDNAASESRAAANETQLVTADGAIAVFGSVLDPECDG